VIEVPVKVSIDLAKWKAWADKADKVLGAIALAKGSIKWNLKDSTLCPLTVARKEFASGLSNQQKKPSAIMSSFSDYAKESFRLFASSTFFNQLITNSCASGAVLLHNYGNGEAYPKIPIPTNINTVTILDAPNGKSRVYQLPEDCFAIANNTINLFAAIDIELLNKEGESLGSKIEGWKQVISAQTVGKEDIEVFPSGCGQGSRLLYIKNSDGGYCSSSQGFGGLYIPNLIGKMQRFGDSRDSYVFTTSAVFPYRFRLDATETTANPQPTVSVSVGGPVKIDSK